MITALPIYFKNIFFLFHFYNVYLFFFSHFSNSKRHDIIKRNINQTLNDENAPTLIGFHIVESSKEPENENGMPVVRAGSNIQLRLFGNGFSESTMIGLTAEALNYGEKCIKINTDTYKVITFYFSFGISD
jgi:hypothetical protein